jgi:hypothetical protein
LAMILAGYHPVRVSARMVFSDWDTVARAIAAALARREPSSLATQDSHLRKRSTRRSRD